MNAINNFNPPPPPTPTQSSQRQQRLGSVSLVGAGPGASDLLTLRALRALEAADVVFYDSLVGDAVLALIQPGTRMVFVGKRKGSKAMEQAAIIELLREEAWAGNQVVRLKGGDPFVFGRGGEELSKLRADGISAHVIPGITAAGAAAAEFGIPLTHRDVATSVTFATGHAFDGSTPDLSQEVLSKGTLVVYMGVSNAGEIANQLMSKGTTSETPVAIIERASLPGQRLVQSSVGTLAADIITHRVSAPALLIIGEVAGQNAPQRVDAEASMISETKDSFAWVHHPMG